MADASGLQLNPLGGATSPPGTEPGRPNGGADHSSQHQQGTSPDMAGAAAACVPGKRPSAEVRAAVLRGIRRKTAAHRVVSAFMHEREVSKLVGHRDKMFRESRLLKKVVTTKWLADPRSFWRQCWDVALAVVVVITLMMTPWELGFNVTYSTSNYEEDQLGLVVLDWLIISFFFMDMALTFRTAVIEDDAPIQDTQEIAKRYLRCWFWIDLLATFPFGEFAQAVGLVPSAGEAGEARTLRFLRFFRLIRLLRMLRVLRLGKMMSKLGETGQVVASILRFVRLAVVLVITAHFLACGWHFIAMALHDEPDTEVWGTQFGLEDPSVGTWERYTLSLYWALVTLTTVGYGDISANNDAERWYIIVSVCLGNIIFAGIIGKVTTLAQQAEQSYQEYQAKMTQVEEWLHTRDMPPTLRSNVRRYFNTIWSRGVSYDEAEIIESLSFGMRREILRFLHAETLRKVPFFEDASDIIIDAVVLHLVSAVAIPGDVIISEGEVGQHLFLLRKGIVEVKERGRWVRDLSDNSFFGEEMVLAMSERMMDSRAMHEHADQLRKNETGGASVTTCVSLVDVPRRKSTVTAVDACELALLSIDAMLSLMEEHEQLRFQVRRVSMLRNLGRLSANAPLEMPGAGGGRALGPASASAKRSLLRAASRRTSTMPLGGAAAPTGAVQGSLTGTAGTTGDLDERSIGSADGEDAVEVDVSSLGGGGGTAHATGGDEGNSMAAVLAGLRELSDSVERVEARVKRVEETQRETQTHTSAVIAGAERHIVSSLRHAAMRRSAIA